ncbi:MAG: metalloregulator ArsR/SmtB family transcription factor [Lagierella massiliensis]|nr:metalloregulator ArsR/SmtB family transcription factor [Lagierella massiliensis]
MKVGIEHRQSIVKNAEILKAIGNPARLCLLEKLIKEGPTKVTDITSCMDISQSAVSQHLRKLKDMGILSCEKKENRVYYFCDREDIKKIISCLNMEV